MKSLKLAIIALLGFSTACTTTKQATKSEGEKKQKIETVPPIVVMYGVRRPVKPVNNPQTPELHKSEQGVEQTTIPDGNAKAQ